MPLQLFVQPRAGEILGNAISGIGDDLSQGIQNLAQNRQIQGQNAGIAAALQQFAQPQNGNDSGLQTPQATIAQYQQSKAVNASATADNEQKIGGAMQGGQLQAVSKFLPPKAQKLLSKMQTEGGLSLSDNLFLNGALTAALKTNDALNQQQLQQQQIQAGAIQNQMARARMQMMLGLFGGGQGQGQQPQGMPTGQPGNMAQPISQSGGAQVKIQPPQPVKISDPAIQAQYPTMFQLALGDPDKAADLLQKQVDAINATNQANYTKLTAVTRPTGNLYFKSMQYKDGMPQNDVYSPEIVTGPGTASESISEGNQDIIVPHGTKPPGNVVSRANSQAAAPQDSPYNTNDPTWQNDVKSAYENAGQSAIALSDAAMLKDAAEAYAAGNSSRLNGIIGNPGFAKYRQLFSKTGANPMNGLQIALAANTSSILNQIRGQNGSVGGRILQNEYENTAKILGAPTMDNPTILAAAQNVYNLNLRRNLIDQAYAKYRESMPSGDAEALAIKQFGSPPNLTVTGRKLPPGWSIKP